MNSSNKKFSVIIVGSGMAGVTLACALAAENNSLSIALVDATPSAAKTDARLIALSYSSVTLLQHLQLWPALAPHAAAIHQVHVSQRGKFGITRLDKDELGTPQLGFVVPAEFINTALADALANTPQIEIFRPATLQKLVTIDNQHTITLTTPDGDMQLETTILIGADGTHSTVRKLADIATTIKDYQQTAIVTVTQLQRPHQHIAYERFHATGAVAMLPLPGNAAATIWTEASDRTQQLMQLSDTEFLQQLQQQFGYRLGRLLSTGARQTYPVQMHTAAQVIKNNIVLIGNAAHTLHPIAAQGLNLTLAEIALLSQIISAHPANPDWQRYLTWQQQQQSFSTRLSNQLPALFSTDFLPLTIATQLALLGLDLCQPAKRHFAKKAGVHANPIFALLREQ
jgi:2-octaprenyl-6-methoxyphenol hydroxylase